MSEFVERRLQWERMGLCCKCGGLRLEPAYKWCAECRSKNREKKLRYLYGNFPEPSKVEKRSVPSDHKCWTCEWSRYEDDRFFCPFVEGTCAKEGTL